MFVCCTAQLNYVKGRADMEQNMILLPDFTTSRRTQVASTSTNSFPTHSTEKTAMSYNLVTHFTLQKGIFDPCGPLSVTDKGIQQSQANFLFP